MSVTGEVESRPRDLSMSDVDATLPGIVSGNPARHYIVGHDQILTEPGRQVQAPPGWRQSLAASLVRRAPCQRRVWDVIATSLDAEAPTNTPKKTMTNGAAFADAFRALSTGAELGPPFMRCLGHVNAG
jgi:hypothetical protein